MREEVLGSGMAYTAAGTCDECDFVLVCHTPSVSWYTRTVRRFTLIRHGTTDWNARGLFQGSSDIPLDGLGKTQAEKLATVLAHEVQSDAFIVSSPLLRAYETAQLALPGRDIRTDDRLMELRFGEFEGSTLADNMRHPHWATWFADPYEVAPPGGETYRQLRERTRAWFQETALLDVEHVVAFSHSGAIQMILADLLHIDRPSYNRRLLVHNTGISRVSWLDKNGRTEAVIHCVNDTRHLAPEDIL